MENDIYKIYHNNIGIAFKWKYTSLKQAHNKIQIVFRNMGFYLTIKEIKQFYKKVNDAKDPLHCSCCNNDPESRNILLKTPSEKVDIAVNQKELFEVEDLIKGTLFQLDLDNYLNNICKN
ncbi:hypothetical protein MBM09_01355 [Flaviramulus sp. BrNp1-15]|uniref:DUF6686 family protein n=1 Tax=Flaviramulus sp. BrNp1-15 TaxID=2916754 RepID=UPI001EE99D01|nr:DUF6686 family protein [Flaviramulus sp. BrNp1-15]ULC59635.1 hypothetical protein MBM09_01355 [Flaviramulus sp. BrNp1-15]